MSACACPDSGCSLRTQMENPSHFIASVFLLFFSSLFKGGGGALCLSVCSGGSRQEDEKKERRRVSTDGVLQFDFAVKYFPAIAGKTCSRFITSAKHVGFFLPIMCYYICVSCLAVRTSLSGKKLQPQEQP